MYFNKKKLFKLKNYTGLKIFKKEIELLFFIKILFFLALSSCGKYGKLKLQHECKQNTEKQQNNKKIQNNTEQTQSQENKYILKQYNDDFNF